MKFKHAWVNGVSSYDSLKVGVPEVLGENPVFRVMSGQGESDCSSLPWPQKVLEQSVISAQGSECQSHEIQARMGKRRE